MASKVLTWLLWIIISHSYYAISNSNDLILYSQLACCIINVGKEGTRKENKLPGITLRAAKYWSLCLVGQLWPGRDRALFQFSSGIVSKLCYVQLIAGSSCWCWFCVDRTPLKENQS